MIDLSDKLPELDKKLFELLRNLDKDEWHCRTVAKLWTVKDVAAHLLDGNIRVLSGLRDGFRGESPSIRSYQDLVDYLNRSNAEWVAAMKRVSPNLLMDLLEHTGPFFCDYYASLDPMGKAVYPVAWAGENESRNWMHIAREYTEKFLHQQQIRDAVGKQGIMTKEYFNPFLEVCLYALPYTLRDTKAEKGDTIKVTITGEAGGTWHTRFNGTEWVKIENTTTQSTATAELVIDQDSSWKLFSKSVRPRDLEDKIKIRGNRELGQAAAEMVSFMA